MGKGFKMLQFFFFFQVFVEIGFLCTTALAALEQLAFVDKAGV